MNSRASRTRRAWPTLLLLLVACTKQSTVDEWSPTEQVQILSLSLEMLPAPPPDFGNAHADDPRAAEFGRKLFHDTRLSRNGTVACATCHQPDRFFTDGLQNSRGLGQTRRHAPSLLGVAWSPWQFWDGRADSLWSQVLGPLQDPDEMGLSLAEVASVIRQHHLTDYEIVFGRLPATKGSNTEAARRVVTNIGKALAAFERGLRPAPARFDAFAEALRRKDPTARQRLTPDERAGLRLFIGRGQCLRCHHGPLLTNHGFHNTGLAPLAGQVFDRGRADGLQQVLASGFNCRSAFSDSEDKDCPHLDFARSGTPELVGAFKTPSLRNVAATAPYMHDGRFASLREVLEHYNRAPGPALDYGHTELFPLALDSTELGQLEAFLLSLGSAETGPEVGRAE